MVSTSSAIIVLAGLLYVVLRTQHRHVALVALGWWLAEAVILALSKIGALALIPLSQDYVSAGAPAQSYHQALGDILYYGVHTHFWFYCIGGLLWYALFYQSKYIPRAISLFGLIAVSVATVGVVVEFLGYAVPIFVYLP